MKKLMLIFIIFCILGCTLDNNDGWANDTSSEYVELGGKINITVNGLYPSSVHLNILIPGHSLTTFFPQDDGSWLCWLIPKNCTVYFSLVVFCRDTEYEILYQPLSSLTIGDENILDINFGSIDLKPIKIAGGIVINSQEELNHLELHAYLDDDFINYIGGVVIKLSDNSWSWYISGFDEPTNINFVLSGYYNETKFIRKKIGQRIIHNINKLDIDLGIIEFP